MLAIKAKSKCKDIFPAAPEHKWDEIWLKIGTRENIFLMHWSADTHSSTIIKVFIFSGLVEHRKTIIKVIRFDLSIGDKVKYFQKIFYQSVCLFSLVCHTEKLNSLLWQCVSSFVSLLLTGVLRRRFPKDLLSIGSNRSHVAQVCYFG